jgi:sigma-B regulation protein RsbU (phosphoserine phosphatase)
MEETVFQRLKEGLLQQRQNLKDWLTGASPTSRELRLGPSGEKGLQQHFQTLEVALQKADDRTLGLCTVCDDYIETSRLEMDYTACVCIEHLTGEERTLLENELELSQKVQRALLPHTVPPINGLEIAAFSQPAHIVGGDYFDFLRLRDGCHLIAIADVMGKGMPASLLMASLQASLRIIAPESTTAAEVAIRLNRLFCHNIRLTKFVTLFLARVDENGRKLTYCNAGHNPPLLYRVDGTITSLRPTGAAIGLAEQSAFFEQSTVLSAGDTVVMYTDGVVEAVNAEREEFGQERLEEGVRSLARQTPQQMIGGLRERVRGFTGTTTLFDDTTMIAVRVTGT